MMSRLLKTAAALALGAAIALPLAASAQQPAAPAAAPAAQAPQAGAPASTNLPPAWSDVSGKAQYASVPGRETNILIQGAGPGAQGKP